MPLLRRTQRNVTIIAWFLYPFFVIRLLPDLFLRAADDVWCEIDCWRPLDDYTGDGRGPSVRDARKARR